MAKRYRVTLTDEERERLEGLTRKGTASVRMVRRAQTLLLAAEGADRRGDRGAGSGSAWRRWSGPAAVRGGGAGGVAAGAAAAGGAAEAGAEGAGVRGRAGLHEAAGGAAPLDDAAAGRRVVELRASRTSPMRRSGGCSKEQAQAVAEEAVGDPDRRRRVRLSGWRTCSTCTPSRSDPARPVVCFDETRKQLVAETRAPAADGAGQARSGSTTSTSGKRDRQPLPGHPAARGLAARRGHRPPHQARLRPADARPGRRPLPGRPTGSRRARQPEHPHPGRALRGVPAGRGARVCRKLEFHYTPVHGSWLNMAEARPTECRDAAQW